MTKTGFATARWGGDERRAERYYEQFEGLLEPIDIARTIGFALDQPPGACLNEITVAPVVAAERAGGVAEPAG
jgi:NADP-dependent 3-hydroxy acid dehydrogenase YdfG